MEDEPPPARVKAKAKAAPVRAKVKAKPSAVEPGKPPVRARPKVRAKPRAAAAPVALAVFVGEGVEISITASDLSTVNQAVAAALGAEGELEFFDPDFEEWAAPSNLAELQGKRVRVVGPNGPVEVAVETNVASAEQKPEVASAAEQEAAEAAANQTAGAAEQEAAEAAAKQAAAAAEKEAAEEASREAAAAAAKEVTAASEKLADQIATSDAEEGVPPEQLALNIASPRAAATAIWLQERGLGEFAEVMEKEGFVEVDELEAMAPEDLRNLCQEIAAAATAAQREQSTAEHAARTQDSEDAEVDAHSTAGGGAVSGFKMMRKAKDAAKDAANLSKDAAKSAKRTTRRLSLDFADDADEFNPYDVGHEDDSDEEDHYDEPDQDGSQHAADEEQQAKVGGGGFGLGRVSGGGFAKTLDIGKNLDFGARAGAGFNMARGASKAAMEKAAKAQEAATKAAKLAEERSREVANSINVDLSSLIEVAHDEDGGAEQQFAVVREDYTPSYESAIGGRVGDRLMVLDGDADAEWWQVKVVKTGKVGFMPKSFIDLEADDGEPSMIVPTAAEVLSSMGLADGGDPSDLEQKLAERVVELSGEVVKLRKLNRARLAKEEKRRAAQARKEDADRKKKQENDAKVQMEKDKAAAKAAALMDAMMDSDSMDHEAAGGTGDTTSRAAAPTSSSKLTSSLRKSKSRDGNSSDVKPTQQAKMAMIVQSFGPGDEGWDAEGGTTVAVDAGMAVRIVDSSDPDWWKVTVLAGGDRAKDEAGRIPASAALSTAAGGKGDWSRAATSSEEIGTNATAPSPSPQEPGPAATAGEQLDGGGSGVRKFGKGLPKGIGAGGMLDKAKKKAEQAAERAKKEAEKAAVGAAAGATAVAARASASGPGGTDGMRGVLKKDYTPSFESAIGGSAGDEVVVVQQNEGEWWTCRNMKTGKQGFMPASFVKLSEGSQ